MHLSTLTAQTCSGSGGHWACSCVWMEAVVCCLLLYSTVCMVLSNFQKLHKK